jgi:DNA-binding transcriptional MerR regulator
VEPFDLKTLCDLTRVSPRTVYFYVQQGLLPPAEGAGRGARYTEVHRDRLRLIRQLQDQHLPLAEIRKQIEGLTGEELKELTTGPDESSLVGGAEAPPLHEAGDEPATAADYIRSVLSGHRTSGTPARRRSYLSPPPMASRLVTPHEPPSPTHGERSSWERVSLAPELELHVRRPLSRVMNRKLERLLEFARALMKETS